MKLKNILGWLDGHSNTILTCVSIVTTVAAVYRAFKDGPKCKKILEELNEQGASNKEKATAIVKTIGPTIGYTAVSVTSQAVNWKKNGETIKDLVSLYSTSRTINEEFRRHTQQVIGDEKMNEIDHSIAKAHAPVEYDTAEDGSKIISTGHGNDLFYDSWSGRFFYSDINYVKKCVNDLNYQLMNDMFVSVNEFYAYIGLSGIGAGDSAGWNVDFGMCDLAYVAELDDNDKPYTMIKFLKEPCSKYEPARRW